MTGNNGIPFGNIAEYSNSSTALTLTAIVDGEGVDSCMVQVVSNSGSFGNDRNLARFRVDGGTASSSSGMYLGETDIIIFRKGELKKGVSIIPLTDGIGTPAKIIYQYYTSQ